MINTIISISAVIFAVVLAGLFAGSETGIYQLSRIRLRLGIEKKQLLRVILGKSLQDSSALLISLLIGTNLAHYVATSIITYMLLRHTKGEHTAELLATLMTTPTLFVFSELLPKSIFFYRSDTLMPYMAPLLYSFHKLFSWCGAVALLKFISRIFAKPTDSASTYKTTITALHTPHIKAIVHETREEGFLSVVQTDIINRLTDISHLRIKSVMTPINKVQMVDINSDNSALLKKLKKTPFTRLPVYDRQPSNILGFINIYEALSSTQQFTNLEDFIEPIRKLSADTSVSDAINIMQSEKQKIVLIITGSLSNPEKPIGIVTMKDLVEELVGELVEW